MLKKLLYAETKLSVRKEIEKFAAENGIETAEVKNTQELLAKAVDWFPDCILTSHAPPFLNAFDICAYRISDPILSLIPVIVTLLPEDKSSLRKFHTDPDIKFIDKRLTIATLREVSGRDEFTQIQNLTFEPSLNSEDRVMSYALSSCGKYFELESFFSMLLGVYNEAQTEQEAFDMCFGVLSNYIAISALVCSFKIDESSSIYVKHAGALSSEKKNDIKLKLDDCCSDIFGGELSEMNEYEFMPGEYLEMPALSECDFYVYKVMRRGLPAGFIGFAARAADIENFKLTYKILGEKMLFQLFFILEHVFFRTHLGCLYRYDTVTGVKNRTSILDSFRKEFMRAKRYGQKMTVLLFDINDTGKINRYYGEKATDLVIKETAGVIAKSLRTSDDIGRLGGDEFLVILTDTPSEDAGFVITRIKNALNSYKLTGIATGISPTFSCVASGLDLNEDTDSTNILKRLEMGLNKLQKEGKDNFICI